MTLVEINTSASAGRTPKVFMALLLDANVDLTIAEA
jgi:hypothetical protein